MTDKVSRPIASAIFINVPALSWACIALMVPVNDSNASPIEPSVPLSESIKPSLPPVKRPRSPSKRPPPRRNFFSTSSSPMKIPEFKPSKARSQFIFSNKLRIASPSHCTATPIALIPGCIHSQIPEKNPAIPCQIPVSTPPALAMDSIRRPTASIKDANVPPSSTDTFLKPSARPARNPTRSLIPSTGTARTLPRIVKNVVSPLPSLIASRIITRKSPKLPVIDNRLGTPPPRVPKRSAKTPKSPLMTIQPISRTANSP